MLILSLDGNRLNLHLRRFFVQNTFKRNYDPRPDRLPLPADSFYHEFIFQTICILALKNTAMIQRIQSLWLLLASVCSFLTFRVSFYYGTKTGATINEPLNATSDILLIILAAATGVGAFIAIFLFKDRKTQLRVTIATILLSIVSIVIYFARTKNYTDGRFTITALVAMVVPIFLFLAAKGIWKDQKLVKSLDRLR
ncbi:MAG: hypothetical protein JWM28_1556 [Chitinophagaceae bacterium]|nr:hypothetical protein [Chitinophagaceae bacterium]